MQRTAKKYTNNYNARAQPLFCSLNLLFDVLVAVVVVFGARSQFWFKHKLEGSQAEKYPDSIENLLHSKTNRIQKCSDLKFGFVTSPEQFPLV